MKKSILMAGFIFAGLIGFAQTTEWKIDNAHSIVGFEVDHMVVSSVTGKFDSFEGKILSDKPDFSDAAISFTIQVASVNTENEKRDGHLQGADFFDVAKYPTIGFKGKSLTQVSGNKYVVKGDLTMHGVTKAVELNVKYNGTVKDPWGGTRAGFKVSGEIVRADYGLLYNSTLEAGGVMIGESVAISVNLELIKQ
ncbi:MAG: YceI family protein [Bacteroidales bacterium]|nr:YceI family protein [Bacteroidales bacterium]